jgi:hypothetical protein
MTNERRLKTRYPLELLLHWRTGRLSGTGITRDMSSCGLAVRGGDPMPRERARIEIAVDWPFLLHGETELRLWLDGVVVRVAAEEFAVRFGIAKLKTVSRAA